LTHHLEALPSIDVFQDSQQFTCRPTFSTESATSGRSTTAPESPTIVVCSFERDNIASCC
jgi:hypothetical protein